MDRIRPRTATLVGAVLALMVGALLAPVAQASTSSPDVPSRQPAGYTVVTSPAFADPALAQSVGHAKCPPGTVVVGGGVHIDAADLRQNINGSYPASPTAWVGSVNNATDNAGTFEVYVVCVRKPKKYKVVSASVTNNASTHNVSTVLCPSSTNVLGGGGLAGSSSTVHNLGSSLWIASGTLSGWRVDGNNASGAAAPLTVYAICGVIAGTVRAATSPPVTLNPGQGAAFVACPGPSPATYPMSGGAFTPSASLWVNLHSTFPVSGGWFTEENNASGGATTLASYVVCAP